MERLYRKIGVLLTAAALAASGHAQQSPSPVDPLQPAEPPAPQYRVEVIVFAYNEADPTEEIFRPRPVHSPPQAVLAPDEPLDLARFDLDALTHLNHPAAAVGTGSGESQRPGDVLGAPGSEASREATGPSSAALPSNSPAQSQTGPSASAAEGGDRSGTGPASAPFRFRILEAEELQLNGAYSRLERLDAYTPLLHGGWIQDGLPENQARPFDIAYLGTFNPAGTIRLHVSRFLHLTLDLDYRPTALQRAARPSGPPESFGLAELSLAPRYVLSTSRRVPSGDLSYFDHPYFGLIVVVTPYEPTPETPIEGVGPAA